MARQYKAGLRKTPNGSVIDGEGNLLYISCQRFIRDIAEGDCCFMCGAKPGSRPFNDEHVIPDWVLRDLGLHNKQINHGNFRSTTYSRFRVPCCVECNSTLGRKVETPISTLFKGGPQAMRERLTKEGPWSIFAWLNLVYLKFLLFDRSVRIHRDPRNGAETIGQAFDWSSLHHLHCVARAYLTEPEIDHRIMGSTFFVSMKRYEGDEPFDWCDIYADRVIMFRFRDIAVISVLDDACATYTKVIDPLFLKLVGPLSPPQLRELTLRIADARHHINETALFHTEFDFDLRVARISVEHPDTVTFHQNEPDYFGRLMEMFCSGYVLGQKDEQQKLRYLREGRWSFLFDPNGDVKPAP
jgi:hypothetical protein